MITTKTAPGRAGFSRRIPSWPASILAMLINWQRRASQRQHLRELDDRLLGDMGMRRGDADAEADKPFWRP